MLFIQHVNLTAHLKTCEENITSRIPDATFNGIVVVDFEEWRPLFKYNNYNKQVWLGF